MFSIVLIPALLLCTALACPTPIELLVAPNGSEQPPTNSECSFAVSIDSAFQVSQLIPVATLSLVKSRQSYTISREFRIQNSISIRGNAQTVRFSATITVISSGSFSISNATLTQNSGFESVFVTVNGQLRVDHCTISSVDVTLISLQAGIVEIIASTGVDNSGSIVAVDGWNSTLRFIATAIHRHTGTIVTFTPVAARGSALLEVVSSSFQDCIGTDSQVLFEIGIAADGGERTGSVKVDKSSFLNNGVPLFAFRITQAEILFSDSLVEGSSQNGIVIDQTTSVFSLIRCVWTRNSALILDVVRLDGTVSVIQAAISSHSSQGMFAIRGANTDFANCAFVLSNSTLFESEINSPNAVVGIVLASHCFVLLSQSSVRQVRVVGDPANSRLALFYVENGALELRNVHSDRSGSSFYYFLAVNSMSAIVDCTLERSIAGGNLIIGAIFGNLVVRSTAIFGVEQNNDIYSKTAFSMPVLIGWTNNDAAIDDIVVSNQTFFRYASIFTTSYSTFDINKVALDSLEIDVFIGQLASKGSISNITIRNTNFRLFLMQLFINSVLYLNAFHVTNLRVETPSHGFFCIASNSRLVSTDLIISDSQSSFILLASRASVSLTNSSLTHMKMDYLMGNTNAAVVDVFGLSIDRSEGGLAHAFLSKVSISDSRIEDCVGRKLMLDLSDSSVTLSRLVVRRIYTQGNLGKFTENSLFACIDCTFQYVESIGGFLLKDSSLQLFNSSFRDFNTTLFQCHRASASVSNSSFINGVSFFQSAKSSNAFGGVLGCVNCKSVHVDSVVAFNVSSKIGGVFALRSLSSEPNTEVYIKNSEFTMCSASSGGAIFLQNASFAIESSTFLYNNATNLGGAIDILCRDIGFRVIRNSVFRGNSANEGGAVKWQNSEIDIINVSFSENSADYGANIASYGVSLSSQLTDFPTNPPAGQPLLLLFEILDHYGNRVTIASNKVLTLQSTSQVAILGNAASISNKGLFRFPEVSILAQPASRQIITAEMRDNLGFAVLTISGSIEIAFRNCSPGEIHRPNMCELCHSGNVSYSPEDSNCMICPQEALCFGGSNMTLREQHWRSAENSTDIRHCPLPDKCLGGVESVCAPGFRGKLCSECEANWYRVRVVDCRECGSTETMWLAMVAILVEICAFFHFVLRYGLKRPNEVKLFALKSAVSHAQLLSMVVPIRVTFPDGIRYSLRAVAYVSSLLLTDLPLACIGCSSPEYTRAVIGSAAFPLLCLCSAAFVAMCSRPFRASFRILASSCLLFTPAIAVQTLAPLLSCQKSDSDAKWLFADMSHPCGDDTHSAMLRFLMVPSVILNVGVPLFGVAMIAWRFDRRFAVWLPLWKAGYSRQAWELVLCLSRTVSLWTMFSLPAYRTLEQVAYGLITLILVSIVNVSFQGKSFKSSAYFVITEASGVIVAVSVGLAAYYSFYASSNSGTDFFIVAVFSLLNGGYFIACGCLLVRGSPRMFAVIVRESSGETSSVTVVRVPHNSIAVENGVED